MQMDNGATRASGLCMLASRYGYSIDHMEIKAVKEPGGPRDMSLSYHQWYMGRV